MLTALHLESFKAVAARQRIDLAPLTVLFGPNGAGKSTILLALLYLHELLVRGNPNVDRTELGGAPLELGGFARLVHGHDLTRTMVLRADFATPRSLDRFRERLDCSTSRTIQTASASVACDRKIPGRTSSPATAAATAPSSRDSPCREPTSTWAHHRNRRNPARNPPSPKRPAMPTRCVGR